VQSGQQPDEEQDTRLWVLCDKRQRANLVGVIEPIKAGVNLQKKLSVLFALDAWVSDAMFGQEISGEAEVQHTVHVGRFEWFFQGTVSNSFSDKADRASFTLHLRFSFRWEHSPTQDFAEVLLQTGHICL
jgi:hypothetical protein